MSGSRIVPRVTTGLTQRPAKRTKPDRQQVPQLLRGGLYALLLVAGAASLPALGDYGPLPTTAMLDAWMIAFVAATVLRGATVKVVPLVLLGLYFLTRVVPAVLNDAPAEDFLQAYRWLLYLAAFVLAVGRQWGSVRPLRAVTFALVGMALLKAALTYVVLGPGERPGLLLENNFEIALFSGLFAVLYSRMSGPQRLVGLVMLGSLMVLAGSRSGAAAFAVLLIFALSQTRITRASKVFAALYVIPAAAVVPLFVFAERTKSVASIDRLFFLDVFLTETRHWGLIQWLVGTTPITPLSPGSCSRLAYYDALFSSAGDGSCYVVILHAFVLRVVFDAGLLGLVLAFGMSWLTMRWARVPTSLALTLLAIAGANSLSVSGLNNPYVALPILLAIVLTSSAGQETDVLQEHPGGDGYVAGRVVGDVQQDARGRQRDILHPRTQ